MPILPALSSPLRDGMARKLTSQDLENYRALLVRLRREISGDIDDLEHDAFATDGERPSTDNPADVGSDSFAQEFSLELMQRDEATRGEIEDALRRLERGTFGRCEQCEAWIPKSRLNTVPHARKCVGCQREAEQTG